MVVRGRVRMIGAIQCHNLRLALREGGVFNHNRARGGGGCRLQLALSPKVKVPQIYRDLAETYTGLRGPHKMSLVRTLVRELGVQSEPS